MIWCIKGQTNELKSPCSPSSPNVGNKPDCKRTALARCQIFTEHLALELPLNDDDARDRKQSPHDLSEQSCEQPRGSSENRYILGSWKKYFESKLEKQESQGKKAWHRHRSKGRGSDGRYSFPESPVLWDLWHNPSGFSFINFWPAFNECRYSNNLHLAYVFLSLFPQGHTFT